MTIFADMNAECIGTPQEKQTVIGTIITAKVASAQGDIDLALFSSSTNAEAREELQRQFLHGVRDGQVCHFVGTLDLTEYTSSMSGETVQSVKMALFNFGDEPKEELGDRIVARVTGCRFDEREVEHGEIDGKSCAFLTFTSDCGAVKGSEARKTITVSAVVAGQELLDDLEAAADWNWIDVAGDLEVGMQDDSKFLLIRVSKLTEGNDPTERAQTKASRSPSATSLKQQFMSGGVKKAASAAAAARSKKKSSSHAKPFDDEMPF